MTTADRANHPGLRGLFGMAALLMLAACAGGGPVRALSGDTLAVDCHGGYHNWSACRTAAERHCGKRGYAMVAQFTDEGGAVGTRDWSQEGSEVSRTMEFRCN